MRRTQVSLPNDQWKALFTISRKQATPIGELIRRAVARTYPVRHRSRFESALDAITGMWQARADFVSADAYVRALRQDDRLERFTR